MIMEKGARNLRDIVGGRGRGEAGKGGHRKVGGRKGKEGNGIIIFQLKFEKIIKWTEAGRYL